jgi:hypothetical protein
LPARKRRAGRATEETACAALRLRARSPAGIPLAVFANRTFVPRAQLRARLPKGDAKAAACRTHRHRSQRCTSRAGRNAGRHDARAARVRTVSFRPRAPHSLRRQGVPSLMASFKERDGGGYRHRRGEVKGVGIFADRSRCFALCFSRRERGTPMILWHTGITEASFPNAWQVRCGGR